MRNTGKWTKILKCKEALKKAGKCKVISKTVDISLCILEM